MAFFSRKKQQSAAPPPTNVTAAQTPSQALAQLSNNSNRDLASQPGGLRADNSLAQYVGKKPLNYSHSYLSVLQVALCLHLNNDLRAEVTSYHPPIPSNPSSSSSNLVTNQLSPGLLADLHFFLPASLANLLVFLPPHLLPLPSLDTAMLYQQMPVPMENSISSVVSLKNQREMTSTSSQPGTTLALSCRLPAQSQVHGWAMQVPSSGMP